MNVSDDALRVEVALADAVAAVTCAATPPRLLDAMGFAVFPGGGRLRPRLCLAVQGACGGAGGALAVASATAVELLHCASLVHDDLPAFDDADERRGKPSVHRVFGEATAVLVGDALIFAAFETLARAQAPASAMLALAQAGGAGRGLVAGQAWELEPGGVGARIPMYHAQKTGALFELACRLGAVAAGTSSEPFAAFGARLGAAYQLADDLLDVVGDRAQLGKPIGQDARRQRPSAVASAGSVSLALERFRSAVDDLRAHVPTCARPEAVRRFLDRTLVPLESRLRLSQDAPPVARAG